MDQSQPQEVFNVVARMQACNLYAKQGYVFRVYCESLTAMSSSDRGEGDKMTPLSSQHRNSIPVILWSVVRVAELRSKASASSVILATEVPHLPPLCTPLPLCHDHSSHLMAPSAERTTMDVDPLARLTHRKIEAGCKFATAYDRAGF